MNPLDDLEGIRRDVDAELAMVEASREGADPASEAMPSDPTAVEAYKARLQSLRSSVLGVEEGQAGT